MPRRASSLVTGIVALLSGACSSAPLVFPADPLAQYYEAAREAPDVVGRMDATILAVDIERSDRDPYNVFAVNLVLRDAQGHVYFTDCIRKRDMAYLTGFSPGDSVQVTLPWFRRIIPSGVPKYEVCARSIVHIEHPFER